MPRELDPVSGASATPLAKKLGVGAGVRLKAVNAPDHYRSLLEPLPERVSISPRLRGGVDLYHLFTRSRVELSAVLPRAMIEIAPAGAIWVSWPKKASGVETDVTEDTIREIALPLGLVDVKVCAVDEVWSGLKLVIRRANRERPAD